MTRTSAVRLLGVVLTAASVLLAGAAAAQSQGQTMTICHRTGSTTNPWVFMTIDVSTWQEHQAQGEQQAGSLAECAPTLAANAASVAAPPAQLAQPSAPAAQPAQAAAPGVQSAPVAESAPAA